MPPYSDKLINGKTMLYTISTANLSQIHWSLLTPADVVLFWQNGVVLALNSHIIVENILNQTKHCYVLDSDILARGLTDLIDSRINIIDMQQVVSLTAHHFPQISWHD